jgi:hypothetical protein
MHPLPARRACAQNLDRTQLRGCPIPARQIPLPHVKPLRRLPVSPVGGSPYITHMQSNQINHTFLQRNVSYAKNAFEKIWIYY